MGDEGMPFHQCDVCNGIVGLWEEVVGRTRPRRKFMHDRCAQPFDEAIPVMEWLDRRMAERKQGEA